MLGRWLTGYAMGAVFGLLVSFQLSAAVVGLGLAVPAAVAGASLAVAVPLSFLLIRQLVSRGAPAPRFGPLRQATP